MKILLIISILLVQRTMPFDRASLEQYIANGNKAYEEHKFHDAITQYDLALKLDSTFYTARFKRGVAYYANKQFAAATLDFDICIMLNPTDKDAWLQRGLTKASVGDYGEALEDFEKCRELDPFDQLVYAYIEDCKLILHGF